MTLDQFVAAKVGDVIAKERFCLLVAEGIRLTGISFAEVAHEFSTAPGTIGRWTSGASAPANAGRARVVRFLQRRAAASSGLDSQVECQRCPRAEYVSFAHCLRNGWPVCHGETMLLVRHPSPVEIRSATAAAIKAQLPKASD